MTFPADTPDESTICPYLGLVDDAESHATYATEAHRCYRLPTPTRIASQHQENYCLGANHPACPVYQGQGVEATTTPPPARTGPPPLEPLEPQPPRWSGAAAEPEPERPSRQPRRQPETQPFGSPAPGARPRPPRRPATGRVGQRSGGLSMPVATIGLFALAIVIVVIAFFINQALGNDDEPLSPADEFATNQALTQQAGGGGQTQTPAPRETATPEDGATPTASPTENGGEPTPTQPSGNGQVHVVESGDTCSGIANQYGVTLQELLTANGMTEDDCLGIQPGQEIIIP
ncbi:MAG: hypothetical protein Kow0010_17810 [Dehalococcoidia bacterium]